MFTTLSHLYKLFHYDNKLYTSHLKMKNLVLLLAVMEWEKLNQNIPNSKSFTSVDENILNFIRSLLLAVIHMEYNY